LLDGKGSVHRQGNLVSHRRKVHRATDKHQVDDDAVARAINECGPRIRRRWQAILLQRYITPIVQSMRSISCVLRAMRSNSVEPATRRSKLISP
jgi:hypothetical protein